MHSPQLYHQKSQTPKQKQQIYKYKHTNPFHAFHILCAQTLTHIPRSIYLIHPSESLYNNSSFQQIQQMLNKQQIKEFYSVEKILDRRTSINGSFEYFIKWKNYPHRDNTWQPLTHLSTVSSLVENFNEEYQERIRIHKSKKCQSCLACSNQPTHNNQKAGWHDAHTKIDKSLLYSKWSIRQNDQENCKKNRLTYRFDNNYQNRSSKCSPQCKNSNRSQILPDNNYNSYSQEGIFERRDYPEDLQNYSIEQTPINSRQPEEILIIGRSIGQQMFQSGPLNPDQNILQSFEDSSEQIIPLISKNCEIKQEESSPSQSYFYLEDEQKKFIHVNTINKTSESNQLKNSNICEQSGQRPFNLCSMDGSTQSAQKIKGNQNSELERSRNKRNKQQSRCVGESRKKRRVKRSLKEKIKPRIRIDQIPPSTSIHEQLRQFNHKRLCQIQFDQIDSHGILSFKLQNQDRNTIKIQAREIQKLFPKWLKQYYESYI